MKCVCFANADYARHMTDEGWQLQSGLANAGWTLAGWGFDGNTDTHDILRTHQPNVVFVQDPRDWSRDHPGCFDRNVHFTCTHALRHTRNIFRAVVVKDAGSCIEFQQDFANSIGADAIVVYYHPRSVRAVAEWLNGRQLVRIYHSVDREFCETLNLRGPRKRCVVTGATSIVYPVRKMVFSNAVEMGIDAVNHPGYGNSGCHTPEYLKILVGYRVHVATASRYNFALRKIMESVACGCTPVTNLPSYDVLPEIDDVLVRISENATKAEVAEAVERADSEWDEDRALHYAVKARSFYDWRASGARLSGALKELASRALLN